MKKDDYFTNLIQVPPKQKIAITPFDLRTQRDAFSVSLEGLKGVRSSTSTSAITHFSAVEYTCASSRVLTSQGGSEAAGQYLT